MNVHMFYFFLFKTIFSHVYIIFRTVYIKSRHMHVHMVILFNKYFGKVDIVTLTCRITMFVEKRVHACKTSDICYKKNKHIYQHWTNAGILLAVLLAQRWQMIFARRYFAHRADVMCQWLVQCWSNALTSISRAYANVISTILFQVLCWANIIWGYKLSLIR